MIKNKIALITYSFPRVGIKNILLLHTDMKVGHGGASGRFDSLKDVARDYSFILDLEEIKE